MSYSITDNSPSAGYIAWAGCRIVYKGVDYAIEDGNTASAYVWWDFDNPTVFQTTNTLPTLTDDDVLVFFNKNGTHLTVPTASVVDGGLIVAGSIVASALSADCVTAEKIMAGAVTAASLAVNAVGASAIAAGAIVGDHISAGSISAEKLQAGVVTADKLESTFYGDVGQALNYVRRVLTASDEYEDTLSAASLSAGASTDVDAGNHIDHGVSIRLDTAYKWDGAGVLWDQVSRYWDVPTVASGNWVSASQDIGDTRTLQMSLLLTLLEDLDAATDVVVSGIYSANNTDWGSNDPGLDDDAWETLTGVRLTGSQWRFTGSVYTMRYFKIKVTLTTTDPSKRIIVYGLEYRGNVVNVYGYLYNQDVDVAGTAFTISGYLGVPAVTVTPIGDTPVFHSVSGQTKTGFTVKLFNPAGEGIAGKCNIIIMGV